MNTVLRHLRRLVAVEDCRGLTDHELLRRFVDGKDEAAFCALLERHAPMVLGVCRRLLRREQDAEDALQATFLVFVRKAGSIRRGGSVRSWLYGVSCRVARKVGASLARQRQGEKLAAKVNQTQPADEPTWREVQAVLDEELQALPERYRDPILLCCLEGKSREEAAQELGCKEGAVKIRLERGRELLRQRLARRGVTLSAGLAGVLLAVPANAGTLPVRLTAALADAGLKYAAGAQLTGLVPAPVIALTEGMLGSMALAKGKAVVAGLLLVTVFVTGLGASVHFASRAEMANKGQDSEARARNKRPSGLIHERTEGKRPAPEPERESAPPADEAPAAREGPTRQGVVRGVGSDGLSLTVRAREVDREFRVSRSARVLIDGKVARLGDLKPSCRVQVTLTPEEDEILAVMASGPAVSCPLRGIDTVRRTLTVTWRAGESRKAPRTFPVAADAEVLIAGRPSLLSDLTSGTDVVLHLSADQNTVVKVTTGAR